MNKQQQQITKKKLLIYVLRMLKAKVSEIMCEKNCCAIERWKMINGSWWEGIFHFWPQIKCLSFTHSSISFFGKRFSTIFC